jgi:hypothetical protein
MKHKLVLATVCLHTSAILYLGLGAGLLVAISGLASGPFERAALVFLGSFCIVLALAVEVIAYGVARRWLWAWIVGVCVFCLYVPSIFMPLGILGLWGLLHPDSRALFGIEARRRDAPPDDSLN